MSGAPGPERPRRTRNVGLTEYASEAAFAAGFAAGLRLQRLTACVTAVLFASHKTNGKAASPRHGTIKSSRPVESNKQFFARSLPSVSRPKAPLPLALMSDPKVRPELVEEAFRRHHAEVENYLLRRLGNRDEAEELTQAVFVEAVERLPRLESPPDSMLAWLYTVAHRRFVDEIRRRTRRRRRAHLFYRDEKVEDSAYGELAAKALGAALAAVSDEQREIVIARLFDDKPFAEIAAACGISEAAAKMRFTRALALVRERLANEGLAP